MKITAALMLKAPIPGTVKTRLAATVGDRRAARIYRHLVELQLSQIPRGWEIGIFYAPAAEGEMIHAWLAPCLVDRVSFFTPQPEGDLGCRMAKAVAAALAKQAGRVALIGGDCPGLNRQILEGAESAAGNANLVVVPARDGGYVMLMTDQDYPELFQGIAWSTDRVLRQTLDSAAKLNLSFAVLQQLEDVDDHASFQRSGLELP